MTNHNDTLPVETRAEEIPVDQSDAAEPRPSPDKGDADSPETREIGGPPGPEPTRYGDWEKNGRCIDF